MNNRNSIYVTSTGAETGRSVGFVGGMGILEKENNINLS